MYIRASEITIVHVAYYDCYYQTHLVHVDSKSGKYPVLSTRNEFVSIYMYNYTKTCFILISGFIVEDLLVSKILKGTISYFQESDWSQVPLCIEIDGGS